MKTVSIKLKNWKQENHSKRRKKTQKRTKPRREHKGRKKIKGRLQNVDTTLERGYGYAEHLEKEEFDYAPDDMNEYFTQKRSEAMPIDFMIDMTAKEAAHCVTVSRESSFSSVELAASNSLSRESSFSSAASSSGSGIFEADSPRPPSRSSSWRSNEDPSERQLISNVTDQQYQRLHNARARFRKARDAPSSGSSSTEAFHTPPENSRTMTKLKRPEVHGRSASEPEVLSKIAKSKLSSSPAGLVITTPPVKGFIEYRLRSRSFTGEDETEEDRILKDFSQSLLLQVPDNGMEGMRRSSTVRCQKEAKEKMDKNLRRASISERDYELLKKEKGDLQEERDNLRHECDRLQCERDAIKLERDTLLREKEELQAELNNRNDIIHHLQDHVTTSVRSLGVKDEAKSSSTKQRSKSEVRRPAFYFPDELAKTNAYTCL